MLNITDNGTISILSQAADGLDAVDQKATNTNNSFGDLVKGSTDLYYGMLSVVGVVQGAAKALLDLMSLGEQMQRGELGLDAITGGRANADLEAMTATTKGLVSQLDLVKDAYQGISTGIARTPEELARIAQIGAILGEMSPQIGNAQQGIIAFESALEHVGQTRPLAALGLDIQAVKAEYDQLVKEGTDKATAWSKALFDNAGTLADKLNPAINDSTTAVDRLTTAFSDFQTELGVTVANTVMEASGTFTMLKGIMDAFGDYQTGMQKASEPQAAADRAAALTAQKQRASDDLSYADRMSALAAGGVNPNDPGYVGAKPSGPMYGPPISLANQYGPFQNGSPSEPTSGFDYSNVAKGETSSERQDRQQVRTFEALSAEQQFNKLLSSDADFFFGQQSALGKITAEFQAQNDLLTHRKTISTEAQAFGYKGGDQLQTGATNQLESDIATYNKRHGIKTDTASEIAAINGIKIAMGEATPTSIAFEGVNARLSDDFLKGKITAQQYADGLNNMNLAVKDGALNAEALSKATALANNPTGPLSAAHMMNNSEDRGAPGLFNPAKAGGLDAQNDPFLLTKQHANDAHDAIDKMQGLIAGLPDVGNRAFQGLVAQARNASDFASPIISQAKIAQGEIGAIGNQIRNLTGSLSINVGFIMGGSGGGGGHGGSLGPTQYAG